MTFLLTLLSRLFPGSISSARSRRDDRNGPLAVLPLAWRRWGADAFRRSASCARATRSTSPSKIGCAAIHRSVLTGPPSAYHLYSRLYSSHHGVEKAARFKASMSRRGVCVHFVGVWCVPQLFRRVLRHGCFFQGYCIFRGPRWAYSTSIIRIV